MCRTIKTMWGLCLSRQQRRQGLPLAVVLFLLVGFYVYTSSDEASDGPLNLQGHPRASATSISLPPARPRPRPRSC